MFVVFSKRVSLWWASAPSHDDVMWHEHEVESQVILYHVTGCSRGSEFTFCRICHQVTPVCLFSVCWNVFIDVCCDLFSLFTHHKVKTDHIQMLEMRNTEESEIAFQTVKFKQTFKFYTINTRNKQSPLLNELYHIQHQPHSISDWIRFPQCLSILVTRPFNPK